MKVPIYRVRFRLSVGDACAFEDVNGAYVTLRDAELEQRNYREKYKRHILEAERLISLTVARFPHSVTQAMCSDAAKWLTNQHENNIT